MALKIYELNGLTFQFEEGAAPKGAKPVDGKAATSAAKARTPRNKAAKPAADKASKAAPVAPPAGSVEDASDPDASE